MTQGSAQNPRSKLLGLALVAMTVAAYLPAIRSGGFIWDDDDYVLANKTLRGISGLKDIWTDPRATPQYYPLVHTTYWIEYHLWGLLPTGYHVTNVLLHALGAILLWRVLRRLEVPGAWLAAALFAVHPVHVESVAWITERKNILSGVFYLGAALAYLKAAEARPGGDRKAGGYLTAFILFLGALLSKTVTATLPAALLLVMWWKSERDPGTRSRARQSVDAQAKTLETFDPRSGDRGYTGCIRRLLAPALPLVPFFAVGLLLSALTVGLEKFHVGAEGAEWHLSFIDRCLIAGRALWFYAGKLLWPSNLCFNYARWEIDAGAWWQYLYPLSAAAVVALLWAARKRIGRGALVAVLYFAGSLLPALGFFDVYPMRYSFVADHFQYLASIGVLTLASAAIVRTSRLKLLKRAGTRVWLRAHTLATAVLVVLLASLSAKQCGIYRNLETLWLDTIDKNPASWMGYLNLGQLYVLQGRPRDAIPLLEQVFRLRPEEGKAYKNMGVALSNLGRKDEAVQYYRRALKIDPHDAEAYCNIGAALATAGRPEEAVSPYLKALKEDPRLAPAHSNLGKVLGQLGRTDEAIRHHEEALAIMPDLGDAHLNYGETLHAAGRIREAEDRYRTAVSLDPSLAAAHINLGKIAVADQLLPAALHHFRRAVEEAPELQESHHNLAKTLAAIGQFAEAEQHFGQAVALAPQSAVIRIEHAGFLAQRGDKPAARQEYLAAAKLMPGDPAPVFEAGVMDQQLGDTAAAEARFRAVLDLDPTHALARNHLAVLLAGQGKNEEAANLLRRAMQLEPGNAELHNNLGVILVRMGEHRGALEALEEAVRLKPDYGEARKNLEDLRRLLARKGGPS